MIDGWLIYSLQIILSCCVFCVEGLDVYRLVYKVDRITRKDSPATTPTHVTSSTLGEMSASYAELLALNTPPTNLQQQQQQQQQQQLDVADDDGDDELEGSAEINSARQGSSDYSRGSRQF